MVISGPLILNNTRKSYTSDFIDFLNILEKYKIKYWLDYGSLLGAIREKKPILWDSELDISLWNHDLDSFLEIIPALEKSGFIPEYWDGTYFSADMPYSNIKFSRYSGDILGYEIDVHFYLKTKDFAVRPFGSRFSSKVLQRLEGLLRSNSYIKNFGIIKKNHIKKDLTFDFNAIYCVLLSKFSVEIIERILLHKKILVISRNNNVSKFNMYLLSGKKLVCVNAEKQNSHSQIGGIIRYGIENLGYYITNKFNSVIYFFTKLFPRESYHKVKVPIKFFNSFNKSKYAGIRVNVPSLHDDYLKSLYGNWKVPKTGRKAGNWGKN